MKRLLLLLVVALLMAACSQDKADEKEEANPVTPPPTVDSSGFNFGPDSQVIEVPTQTLGVGDGVLNVAITMPDGYKLNTLAPLKAAVSADNASIQVDSGWAAYAEVAPALPLQIPLTLSAGQATVMAHLDIYWCEAVNETLCFVDSRDVVIPVVVSADSTQSQAEAVVALAPPDLN